MKDEAARGQDKAREAWQGTADAGRRTAEGVESEAEREPVAGDAREAKADFKAARGMKIDGDADFEEIADGVKIEVEVEHAPVGKKGIHIHEKGDCSDIEGQNMGSHFAPEEPKHGFPTSDRHHLGDLGNIDIDKDGNGKLEMVIRGANLKKGDPMSLLGRAVVIHESNDKGVQPTGGAGKPMACAVIKAD